MKPKPGKSLSVNSPSDILKQWVWSLGVAKNEPTHLVQMLSA